MSTTEKGNVMAQPPPYTPYQDYQNAPNATQNIPAYYPAPTYQTPPPPSTGNHYPYVNVPPAPNYGATTVVISQPSDILIVNGCPACRVGVLEDDYTCLGIFCAIFFFPLGILCCLALKNKRCTNCGAYFG